jgi:hypothetical protein
MRKISLSICASLLSVIALAQASSTVIFSENGEKFIAYLNGEPKNAAFRSNVRIDQLTEEIYQLRIDFEEEALTDFTFKSFMLETGMLTTYVILRNNKGEFTCRWQSASPIAAAAAGNQTAQPANEVRHFATADDAGQGTAQPAGNGTQSGISSTTTISGTPSGGENVSVNVQVSGVSMGFDVLVEDGVQGFPEDDQPAGQQTPGGIAAGNQEPAVSGAGLCLEPMSQAMFSQARASVQAKTFDETRLSQSKTIASANCLSAAQIRDLCGAFDFEATKLDFAKHAWSHCADKQNYFLVNDVFTFSASVDELNGYIGSR